MDTTDDDLCRALSSSEISGITSVEAALAAAGYFRRQGGAAPDYECFARPPGRSWCLDISHRGVVATLYVVRPEEEFSPADVPRNNDLVLVIENTPGVPRRLCLGSDLISTEARAALEVPPREVAPGVLECRRFRLSAAAAAKIPPELGPAALAATFRGGAGICPQYFSRATAAAASLLQDSQELGPRRPEMWGALFPTSAVSRAVAAQHARHAGSAKDRPVLVLGASTGELPIALMRLGYSQVIAQEEHPGLAAGARAEGVTIHQIPASTWPVAATRGGQPLPDLVAALHFVSWEAYIARQPFYGWPEGIPLPETPFSYSPGALTDTGSNCVGDDILYMSVAGAAPGATLTFLLPKGFGALARPAALRGKVVCYAEVLEYTEAERFRILTLRRRPAVISPGVPNGGRNPELTSPYVRWALYKPVFVTDTTLPGARSGEAGFPLLKSLLSGILGPANKKEQSLLDAAAVQQGEETGLRRCFEGGWVYDHPGIIIAPAGAVVVSGVHSCGCLTTEILREPAAIGSTEFALIPGTGSSEVISAYLRSPGAAQWITALSPAGGRSVTSALLSELPLDVSPAK